jgi:hypothetical protein
MLAPGFWTPKNPGVTSSTRARGRLRKTAVETRRPAYRTGRRGRDWHLEAGGPGGVLEPTKGCVCSRGLR